MLTTRTLRWGDLSRSYAKEKDDELSTSIRTYADQTATAVEKSAADVCGAKVGISLGATGTRRTLSGTLLLGLCRREKRCTERGP